MFTVICCEQQKAGIRRLLSRQEYYVNAVTEGEVQFITLTIKGGKKVNWERVSRILGNCNRNILLQEGVPLPEESKLKRVNNASYRRRMTQNAAKKILARTNDLRENRALLVDERLVFREEAESLLEVCARLTVLTQEAGEYDRLPKERIDYLPFEQNRVFSEQSLVVAPELSETLVKAGICFGQLPILAGWGAGITEYLGVVMTAFAAPLSEQYRPFLPERVNEIAFGAALYSCCGVNDIGDSAPEWCDIYQAGQLVAKRVAF